MTRKGAKRSTPAGPAPRVILCVGLKSSGSTWLYNVVIQLLKEKYRTGVTAFYADNFAMFPPDTERARVLVIKAHEPSKGLVYLTRVTRGYMFLTLREPRDAIASLMQRFEHDFDGALKEVTRHSARIVELDRDEAMTTYRYEDGFFDRFETIGEIATALGIKVAKAVQMRIYQGLTRDGVRQKIGKLQKTGKFGKKPDANSFDLETQWHPGHVGDGRVGKFKSVLTAAQQRKIETATTGLREALRLSVARKR